MKNNIVLVPRTLSGICIPLRESLKYFLEIPSSFNEIMQYVSKLKQETHILSNILQGDLWKNKYADKIRNDIVLPLYLFFDDLEVGNPLGSHAGINKFAAIYVSIACLPPHIASRLHAILFSSILYSSDKNKSDNERIFDNLIQELNFLNIEGILININNALIRVKFQLVLILGDNLGLNEILGFTKSFTTDYFCRICNSTLEESRKLCIEDKTKLRTKSTNDGLNDGVKEKCVFNKIEGFHVTENLTVDLMHDVFEGVCTYIMRSLINTFISKPEYYFSLETLNARIKNFGFGPLGNKNRPPIITMQRLTNSLTLKMSASEMLNLVRCFGLITGDLVPENDEYW